MRYLISYIFSLFFVFEERKFSSFRLKFKTLRSSKFFLAKTFSKRWLGKYFLTWAPTPALTYQPLSFRHVIQLADCSPIYKINKRNSFCKRISFACEDFCVFFCYWFLKSIDSIFSRYSHKKRVCWDFLGSLLGFLKHWVSDNFVEEEKSYFLLLFNVCVIPKA